MHPETWAVVGEQARPDEPGSTLNIPLIPASNFVLGAGAELHRNEAPEAWEALEATHRRARARSGRGVRLRDGRDRRGLRASFPTGAHLVLGDDCSRASPGWRRRVARARWPVDTCPVDDRGWAPQACEADLVWLESPSNPLRDVADLAASGPRPASERTRVVVDNTFATPLSQRPLTIGADIVVHSATKFIGGHSDLLLGSRRRATRLSAERCGRRARSRGDARDARGFPRPPRRADAAAAPRRGEASAGVLVKPPRDHRAVGHVRYPGFGAMGPSVCVGGAHLRPIALCDAVRLLVAGDEPRGRRDDDRAAPEVRSPATAHVDPPACCA